ncbi:MAG: zinc-dependent peptidase [Gemmatimonadetes bacterium]|nr:zinc-dependent peptidase [Gemmatimonadota bacterium]
MRPILMRALARSTPTPVQWLEEPPPPHWREVITRTFPAARRLSPSRLDRLLQTVQLFLENTRFEGAGGFELTEEVELTIASQACYMLLGRDEEPFPRTRRVIVYPETFVPRRPAGIPDFEFIDEPDEATLGESWDHGTVILSWPSVEAGARDPDDGWNVVFHEFAHQLDQGDGESGGMPADVPGTLRQEWQAVVADRLAEIRRDLDDGHEPYLDDYAATNEAEFFAVATETYFEAPDHLAQWDPGLFALMQAYFRWTP